MLGITAILNSYKRPYTIQEQYAAIMNQTIKPDEIMIWSNSPNNNFNIVPIYNNVCSSSCNRNLGVWARFAYALMAKTKYICIFDDDTIPGSRWFENCLKTIKTHNGPLGTIGIRFNSKEKYLGNCIRIGWDGNRDTVERVDFLGHAWFFEKEWLKAYWREFPDLSKYAICAEDMHLSYSIQKYLGLNTYVPPHPANDMSLWGSIKGMQYGTDANSLWSSNWNEVSVKIEEYMQYCISNGWKTVNG
jgi:hypothetical protein